MDETVKFYINEDEKMTDWVGLAKRMQNGDSVVILQRKMLGLFRALDKQGKRAMSRKIDQYRTRVWCVDGSIPVPKDAVYLTVERPKNDGLCSHCSRYLNKIIEQFERNLKRSLRNIRGNP